MGDMLHGKANMLDYDAICTFVFKDYKDFARFMYDPGSKALTPVKNSVLIKARHAGCCETCFLDFLQSSGRVNSVLS